MLKSYFKSAYSIFVQNPSTNIQIIERLNFITVNKILAYHCAHVSYRHKGTVYFDSDAVEAILDTGCSTTISFELNDFIDYKPMKGKVEGLGVHNIVGTGTIKYTVLDDNGDKVNLLIKNAIHVPTMDVRLISLQQIAQQSDDCKAGGDIRADACYLRWNGLLKTVPYQAGSNLPILYTLPGGKIAEAYIAKHTQSVGLKTKAFFLNKGESNSSWNKSLIVDQNINKIQDEDTSNVPLCSFLTETESRSGKHVSRSELTSSSEEILDLSTCGDCTMQEPANGEVSVSKDTPGNHIPRSGPTSSNEEFLDLSISGNCTMQKPANGEVAQLRECKACTVNFENLSQPSRLLLHYHNKLDHMGFKQVRQLASVGFLPRCIAKANDVVCDGCQAGNSHLSSASKTGKIVK